jgi:hypothetical protein
MSPAAHSVVVSDLAWCRKPLARPAAASHGGLRTPTRAPSHLSYDELDPTGSYTLDSVVEATIAVTNHLRDRFGQDRIYLLGQSWGSTLGVLAEVHPHP